MKLATFDHHPDPDIDFGVEAEVLEGMAYDVSVGMSSQWPFWGRLSRALKLGGDNGWFGQPNLEGFLRGLEQKAKDPQP